MIRHGLDGKRKIVEGEMLDLILFVFIQCPIVGFAVMIGGHVVGTMVDNRTGAVGALHKYGLLVGLGFVTIIVHTMVSSGWG